MTLPISMWTYDQLIEALDDLDRQVDLSGIELSNTEYFFYSALEEELLARESMEEVTE